MSSASAAKVFQTQARFRGIEPEHVGIRLLDKMTWISRWIPGRAIGIARNVQESRCPASMRIRPECPSTGRNHR